MISFLDDITRFLAAHADHTFVLGTNLFVGEIPRDHEGVTVIQAPSPEPDGEVAVEYYSIDFWAVNKSSIDAQLALRKIFNQFYRAHDFTTDNFYVYLSHITGQPVDQDRDRDGRKVFQLSVVFTVYSLIS